MEQDQEQRPEFPVFKWRPKEGTPQIYTNYVNVSWTLFDVRFVLGNLIPSTPESKEFIVEERGAVTIAWAQAKVLRDLLTQIVARYEAVNGEIPKINLPSAAPFTPDTTATKNQ